MPLSLCRLAWSPAALLLLAPAAGRAQTTTTTTTIEAPAATAAIPAPPVDAPDFTGTWTLNRRASRSGSGATAARRGSLTVTHQGNLLSYTMVTASRAGTQQSSAALTIGGPAFTEAMAGATVTSTATWDGRAVAFSGVRRETGTETPVTGRWVLSPDGRRLTVTRTGSGGATDAPVTLVYDKQGG